MLSIVKPGFGYLLGVVILFLVGVVSVYFNLPGLYPDGFVH